MLKDGRISYREFVAYLMNEPLESHLDAAARVIDTDLKRDSGIPQLPKADSKILLDQVQLTVKVKLPWSNSKDASPPGQKTKTSGGGTPDKKSKEGELDRQVIASHLSNRHTVETQNHYKQFIP
eukprot:4243331-Amphidinium_carterae.1